MVHDVQATPTYLFTFCGSRHHSFSDLFLIIPSFAASYATGLRTSSPLKDIQKMAKSSHDFINGEHESEILSTNVEDGDANGVRKGEGYWTVDGKRREKPEPMGKVDEIRMHWKKL